MKKEIVLSFKPEYFKPILYGIKKYEYRKRYCKEETKAYLYLSSPVQAIIGIVEFGEAIKLDDAIKKVHVDSLQFDRIKVLLDEKVMNAIPIISLQLFNKPFRLNEIKEIEGKFWPPQCYAYTRNYPKLKESMDKRPLIEVDYHHTHHKVYEDNIGMTCIDMEKTNEFKEQNEKFLNDDQFRMIMELLNAHGL